MPYNVGNI